MPSRINCRHRCVLCWRLNTSKCSKRITGLKSYATLLRRGEMTLRNVSSMSFIYLSQEGQVSEISYLLSAIAAARMKAGLDGCPDAPRLSRGDACPNP
jgi:hypothetical protein